MGLWDGKMVVKMQRELVGEQGKHVIKEVGRVVNGSKVVSLFEYSSGGSFHD